MSSDDKLEIKRHESAKRHPLNDPLDGHQQQAQSKGHHMGLIAVDRRLFLEEGAVGGPQHDFQHQQASQVAPNRQPAYPIGPLHYNETGHQQHAPMGYLDSSMAHFQNGTNQSNYLDNCPQATAPNYWNPNGHCGTFRPAIHAAQPPINEHDNYHTDNSQFGSDYNPAPATTTTCSNQMIDLNQLINGAELAPPSGYAAPPSGEPQLRGCDDMSRYLLFANNFMPPPNSANQPAVSLQTPGTQTTTGAHYASQPGDGTCSNGYFGPAVQNHPELASGGQPDEFVDNHRRGRQHHEQFSSSTNHTLARTI